MGNYSLSRMKYQPWEKKAILVDLSQIIQPPISLCELPPLTDESGREFKLDVKHELSEDTVQSMMNRAFIGPKLGAGFYVCDTHNNKNFLGANLMPDLIVSSVECADALGEYQVAFMIELKAGSVNPCSGESIDQAATYGTSLLELSSDAFRKSAIVVVTNLHKAAIVQARRTACGFEYRYTETSASEALRLAFSSRRTSLGMLTECMSYKADEKTYTLTNCLGEGAMACVYSTTCGNAAKFFVRGGAKKALALERDNLNLLNDSLPLYEDTDFTFQTVVDYSVGGKDKSPPFLVLSPVGTAIYSPGREDFNRARLLKVLRALQFAHIRCDLLHLDIRPDNLLRLSNGDWMLIDWGAAMQMDLRNRYHLKDTKETKDTKESKDAKDSHTFLCEAYTGCVTTAADSVLTALAEVPVGGEKSERGLNVPVSRVTDCISLLRTVFLLTYRMSQKERAQLMKCKDSGDFQGIIRWWKGHLPPSFVKFEKDLYDILVADGDIYAAMKKFIQENVPPVL
jgi:hypothetical protein